MNGTKHAASARIPRRGSRLFVFALTLLALFFVAKALAPQTIGETARRKLLADLQAYYQDHKVSIRRGRFDPEVGLTFEDVRIYAPASSPQVDALMLRIERLRVLTDMHPEKLLDRDLPVETRGVVLDGVLANAWLTDDQQISLAQLLPLPKLGPGAPQVVIRNVSLNLVGERDQRRPITAHLDEVVIENCCGRAGDVDSVIVLRGATDFADDVLLRVDQTDEKMDLRCSIKGVHLSRDLFDRLPAAWAAQTRNLQGLQCECDATLSMHRSSDGELNYQVRTTVHDGRFEHAMLPKPISEMRGVLSCSPRGILIEASQGMFGDAVVRATGAVDGYAWPSATTLNLSARGLLLDDRLAHSLPPSMQAAWGRLQPLGRIDVDAKLEHGEGVWDSKASVVCKGIDVRYERFPYPVESLVGRIEIADGVANAELLTGRVGGNRMQCAFQLPIQPGTVAEKSFVIATDGPIPIDRTLLGSLSPRGGETTKLETFVRSLRPRGSIQLTSALFRTDREGRATRKIDLRVTGGQLRYDKFAYPLYNVTGNILVENELVTIAGMRANNANAGTIRCDGTYRIPNPKGITYSNVSINPYVQTDLSQLSLRFQANNVPMDESLRTSLPANGQHVWDSLSPSGVLDELNVLLEQTQAGGPLKLDLTANQLDSAQVTSRSLSLRPTSLPYRLDVTGGRVRFDGKRVEIESLKGRHDASTLAADGFCVQNSSGRWELLLNLHSGSRLHPDAELIAALPSQMRVAMRSLQLRGPLSLRGQTRFAMPDAMHPEPTIQWDLVLQLEGNRIGDVGPVHSLRGELSIQGTRDEVGIRALGDVRIDSMHVHDIQITGIRGPFSIEGDMLYIGGYSHGGPQPAAQAQAASSPSIRGRLFDGAIDLDGKVMLSSGNFDVGLTIQRAQLHTLLADFGHSDQDLTGTMSGQTQLQGNLGTTDLLRGNGAGRITGANLYKLPLIVQVLNLLRVKPTPDVAFTDGEVEFTLYGETVTFSDLEVWGDLVALQGGGTLNRRRELDLTFNTRVSPQNSFTQLIRPLGQRYTLGTIELHGPIHALKTERKALDRVSETLDWLIPGIADQSSAGIPSPASAQPSVPPSTARPTSSGTGTARETAGWFRQ